MRFAADPQMVWLVAGVLGVLAAATLAGKLLARRAVSASARATAENVNARIRAWWVMCLVLAFALLAGRIASMVLFGLISFLALREFITLTPTRPSDHRTLFWVFFVATPLQYLFLASHWYGLFSIFIPVWAFLFIPTRSALSGDPERFLERTAKIQWGLMVCVYCVSYAPALLMLRVPGWQGGSAKLLFFLILVDQVSDVLQYVAGKLWGRRKIAPHISPNKTWEGFVGGVAGATLIGTALWWATPFRPWEAALMSLAITLMGFAGGLVMSAIKRDRGVKDYGSLLEGHGGMLDRIDSLCFAAPAFFHLTSFFFAPLIQ